MLDNIMPLMFPGASTCATNPAIRLQCTPRRRCLSFPTASECHGSAAAAARPGAARRRLSIQQCIRSGGVQQAENIVCFVCPPSQGNADDAKHQTSPSELLSFWRHCRLFSPDTSAHVCYNATTTPQRVRGCAHRRCRCCRRGSRCSSGRRKRRCERLSLVDSNARHRHVAAKYLSVPLSDLIDPAVGFQTRSRPVVS